MRAVREGPPSTATLVALLGVECTAAVQVAATSVLRNLAFNDNNRVKIAAAGAVPSLLELLGAHQSTAAVREMALVAADTLEPRS